MQRQTRQAEAINQALKASGRPMSVEDVHASAKKILPNLGIATVYRQLKRLVEDGVAQSTDIPGKGTVFEPLRDDHHHYFNCRKCRGAFFVEGCPHGIEEFVPKGFVIERHEVILYGLCPECGAKTRKAAMRAPAR